MTVVKIKKQNVQESVSQKDGLNLKIIKTVWKWLNSRIKSTIYKKNIGMDIIKKIRKNS